MSPKVRTYTVPQPPRAAKFGNSYRFTDNAVLTPGGRRMAEHRAASSYGA